MAPKSKISTMPPGVKSWLEKALIDRSFSGYKELESLLKTQGFDISHASIHRYGQKLEQRLAAIKASTEAAKLIAEAAPDNEDHRSAAVMSLVQTSLFDALLDLQEAAELEPSERIPLLSKAAQGFAKLADASINQKRWEEEVKKKFAALEKTAQTQKKWLDPETLKYIRETIYGV